MNRIIHKGFFKEMCRQLRTKGLVATFILLGLNLIELASFAINGSVRDSMTHLHQSLMLAPTYVFLFIATPILAFGAYRWLNRRAQSDFYHAIPLTRLQLYGSTSAAILLWLAIPITAHTLMRVVMFTAFGSPFNYVLQLCAYLNVLIAALTILGAISIGVSLSGSGFVGFFTAVVILFYPRAFLLLLAALTEVHSGISVPFSLQPFFINPSFNLAATPIHTLFYVPDLGNVVAILYSLAYGLLLLTLGGVAFHKRKSEAAEIPYTNRTVQTLVRIAIGSAPVIGFTALISLLLHESMLDLDEITPLFPIGVMALLFSFVFYCLYELISSKRWKSVVKAMPFYPICLVLAAIIAILPAAIGKPMNKEKINAGEVTEYRYVGDESSPLIPRRLTLDMDYADVVAAKHTFTDREAISRIVSGADADITGLVGVFKNVQFPDVQRVRGLRTSKSEQLKICLQDASFSAEYYAFPKGHLYYLCPGLTNAEAKEVGELFRKDYEALSEAERSQLIYQVYEYYVGRSNDGTPNPAELGITLYGCLGTENYSQSYVINELTPNAAKRYLELLNARNGETVRKALVDFVNWMETGNDFPDSSCEGYFYLGNSNYSLSTWGLRNEVAVNGTQPSRTPKAEHEKEYKILKALSEAPLSTDVSQCVTVRAEIVTDGTRYRTVTVGFRIPEECRKELLEWIAQGEFYGDFVNSSDFGSW